MVAEGFAEILKKQMSAFPATLESLNEAKRSEESPEGFQNIGKPLLPAFRYSSGLLSPCWRTGKPSALRASGFQKTKRKRSRAIPFLYVMLNGAKRSEFSAKR